MFQVLSELRIGSIIEVSGSAIRVELDGKITELTRTHDGRVYPVGQYGSVTKIHFGRRILFAYVRLLRMRSEIDAEAGIVTHRSEDSRIIEADLFGEANWHESNKSLDFHRGLRHYPLPGQFAYLTTHDELRAIYQGAEVAHKDDISPMLAIGRYAGTDRAECFANADKLFGHHCAVLGSTGSGKSATVAAIIHSVLQHKGSNTNGTKCRPRIVIIDPHAEYLDTFSDRAIIFRAYDSLAPTEGEDNSKQLKLPYWMLTAEEFRELIIAKTQFEATTENNIVYKALTHARLVEKGWIQPAKEWFGEAANQIEDPAEPRLTDDQHAQSVAEYDRDTPDPFSLDEFVKHIVNEQGIVVKANKWEKMSTSDFKSHASVLDKLSVLRNDSRLAFMMTAYGEGQPNLPEVIEQLVGNLSDTSDQDIRVVDISGLPNEIAGPLTAAIARLLFQYKLWQTRSERERHPVLLICEEAHRYVPDQGRAEYESAQTAIRRIAKEGRKYGLGLMLVSQRPSDVERTVLSQCNSWLVLRLTNSADQEHVGKFLPDSLQGLVKILPSLSRQEAIFVGEAAAVPARIIIKDLSIEQLPKSQDVAFMKNWHQPPASLDSIKEVVARWRKDKKKQS